MNRFVVTNISTNENIFIMSDNKEKIICDFLRYKDQIVKFNKANKFLIEENKFGKLKITNNNRISEYDKPYFYNKDWENIEINIQLLEDWFDDKVNESKSEFVKLNLDGGIDFYGINAPEVDCSTKKITNIIQNMISEQKFEIAKEKEFEEIEINGEVVYE